MSSTTYHTGPQLNQKQELQNALTAASQCLWQIHADIIQLKEYTKPGGELETSITQNIHALEVIKSLPKLN